MEPKRETGDDRMMWRATRLASGDSCVCEHRQDALDTVGEDSANEFIIEPVLVTAEEWNEMPEFEGW